MKRLFIQFLFLFLCVVLVCCSQQAKTTQPTLGSQNTSTPVPAKSNTPTPEQKIQAESLNSPILSSPLPSPEVMNQVEVTIFYHDREQTPQLGKGNVEGELVINGGPATNHVLYLASVIKASEDSIGVAALDPVHDPRTESDSSGYFVFLDVPPGQYVLGINSPVGPILINRNGKEIKAQVEENDIFDLGTIEIIPFE